MNSPKLLPWYARRAGVPIERAEALWRKAVRKATVETGWVGTSEYFGAAVDNFLELLDEEAASLCAPGMSGLFRRHSRIMRLPLTLMEDFTAVSAAWQRLCKPEQRAA
ncbi:MAG: hypothetical protein KDE68_09460 [Rhodocyclaceae bacterium]|nr:hypothetical protein [Rhodocyclaceae bacterium]